MPPKYSYAHFSRFVNTDVANFERLVTQLEALSPNQSYFQQDLILIHNQIKADYEAAVERLELYRSVDQLPEGLDEACLEAACMKVKDLFIRAELVHNRNKAPMASSTMFNPGMETFPIGGADKSFLNASELPRLVLPKFNGDPSTFNEFYSKFVTLVDENVCLTPKQKLLFLINHLEGSAYEKIRLIPVNDENYEVARKILTDRYQNNRLQAKIFCNNLLQLPSANINSPSSMRELIDCFNLNFSSLKSLKEENIFEAVYCQLILSRLDPVLRERLESSLSKSRLASATEVLSFLTDLALQKECCANITASGSPKPKTWTKAQSDKPRNRSRSNKEFTSLNVSCSQGICPICNSKHDVVRCPKLLALNPRQRYNLVKATKLCISCLNYKHGGSCAIPRQCDKCGAGKHHTLLHFGEDKQHSVHSESAECSKTESPATEGTCMSVSASSHSTLLIATCLVRLQVSEDRFLIIRAILDTASQLSFISESAVQRLGVHRFHDPVTVCGIGASTTSATKGACTLAVANLGGKVLAQCHRFHIMPQISQLTPRVTVSPKVFEATKNLVLADPTFGVPSRVDALLGADIAAAALNGPVIPLGKDLPLAVSTCFGYVIMGVAPMSVSCNLSCVKTLSPYDLDSVQSHKLHADSCSATCEAISATCLMTTQDKDLDNYIKRFWELEEAPPVAPFVSDEDKLCEERYNSTTTRLASGRYMVRLPFKDGYNTHLGQSYSKAVSLLRALEHKFVKNPKFKSLYVDFMNDYIDQGHMVEVLDPSLPKYYIPHHGVFKTHGDTSKIRVVFDASSKSSSGYSLNDVLMTGMRLQALISDIITLFRHYNIVFTSDIQQMFRQILVHPDDCVYQCILWREDSSLPIRVYMLLTVTYGLTCAPYLAIRTLSQLARDGAHKFRLAARAIKNNFFVDDFAGGANCPELARVLVAEIIGLLASGGFCLKKWVSNVPSLLEGLDSSFIVSSDAVHSVLGLRWDAVQDIMMFPIEEMISPQTSQLTKRVVMAQTAKLYDPCGWIAPVVMKAKCLMQRLWQLGLDWDDQLPSDFASLWLDFVSSLECLSEFKIPRSFFILERLQLHGYSDASQLGFSAVLYARCISNRGITCNLIVAKTRVAPLKPVTIPRLELQGAHLLAQLVHHYMNLLSSHIQVESVHLWVDSSIVLHWVRTPPHRLKTFVGNRVAQISDLVPKATWCYVPGIENPADIASRGSDPHSFIDSYDQWLKGPEWLAKEECFWPSQIFNVPQELEFLEFKTDCVSLTVQEDSSFFEHLSSWRLVLRVVVIMLKWIPRYRTADFSNLKWTSLAHDVIMRAIQMRHFSQEIASVRNGKLVRLALQRLVPFIDDFGLLRARGRLANSEFYEGSPPVILPKKDHLVNLLISYTHIKLGHAGVSQVRYHLSLNYWILAARQVIRSIIYQCIPCFRTKPHSQPPLMGDLPAERVNPAPVFYNTGMDYCGPFSVKAHCLRKSPVVKCYVCVFICLAVKAVHLEVATDLSADTFLDVLKRFISRRGCPQRLFSDCGTNFVGGDRILSEEFKDMLSSSNKLIQNFLLDNKIEFNFLPSYAPSMGGLWERAVQSTKFHLRRVLGLNILTLPQMNSLIIQIEGILNSRPITVLSTEPGDCQALTPGHFLIGRAITSPPENDLSLLKDGLLGHYQLVQAMVQRFWKRWRAEYLTTLNSRAKWHKKSPNLSVGDVVVVEEPNSVPRQWPLGRITQVFPARDGVVRRAEVKTTSGVYLRPAIRLYLLPLSKGSL